MSGSGGDRCTNRVSWTCVEGIVYPTILAAGREPASDESSSGAPSTIQEITSRDADEASLCGSDASKFTTSTEEEDLVDVSSEAAEVQPAMNRGEETASFHRETA